MSDKILLAEPPFAAWQGEGSSAGKHALFIRFVGCNLSCCFCDSKYSWKIEEIEVYEFTLDEIVEEMEKSDLIVFTGGEPLLKTHVKTMLTLMERFPAKRYEIETNGTIKLSDDDLDFFEEYGVKFNISPKINIKQEREVDPYPKLINQLVMGSFEVDYKFLFETAADIDFVDAFTAVLQIPKSQIWVQPCGTDADTLKHLVIKHEEKLLKLGFNVSIRTHVFIFGDQVGK